MGHDEAVKVIFLDIDGVLIPYGGPTKEFKGECIAQLQRIVFETGAKLVISSGWRIALYDELLDMLDQYGLKKHVIGHTPKAVEPPAWCHADWLDHCRRYEITEWLEEHPEVGRYICLDDDPYLAPHTVLVTQCHVGLTAAHADRAIKVLNQTTKCMFCQVPLPLWDRQRLDTIRSVKDWGIKPVCPECLSKRAWSR